MEKESQRSPVLDRKNQRKQRNVPNTISSKSLTLSSPRETQHVPQRSGSSPNPKLQGSRGPSSRNRGYNNSRPVRDTSGNVVQRDRSSGDSQAKTHKSNNDSRHREPADSQRKGFRSTRSAPSSAGKPKQTQATSVIFEVKMVEFPELSGASPSKAPTTVSQTECWGPSPLSKNSKAPQPASSSKSHWRGSSTQLELQQSATGVKSDASPTPPAQPVVASWANIASQPPKKPVPRDKIINNHMEVEDVSEKRDGAAVNKKRKKKKKTKGTAGDVNVEIEEPPIPQEPPKFEDEEEFPVLTPALIRVNRLPPSSGVKLCNEGIQRESGHNPTSIQNVDKTQTENQSTEATKKGQKAEKVSGKKSKVPVQLDIGNMLATLEKKQQSQKTKQDSKPLILSVGGGLPVVHKLQSAPKKTPWQQDKIAHNPLDSTSPLVKKGKQREVPKAKKPTPLKRVILKEREERKQQRLLEERGLLPEEVSKPPNDVTEEEEQCDANTTDEVEDPTEEFDSVGNLNDTEEITQDCAEETEIHENGQQQVATSAESNSVDTRKIHSRKFREYCSQMLSKDVDECVTTLLKELVRFQDRLYQKDPMKAHMKRRIVMGLREVLKHLKLRKVKCVIISPNCERIQSKGGLDEALHTIIDTCREQDVPFVFALSRKALGRCLKKVVPVSLVGIFNYDGAQDFYHKMIELSSEARKAYEVMVSSLTAEQEGGPDDQQSNTEELRPNNDGTLPEEPEYMKVWKKMLEKSSNHAFLNFEEQLSSLHLNSECTEDSDEGERS